MLITFIKLTYTPSNRAGSCQVDLTATARRIMHAGIQLVVGDIINAGKLPFEDKQKIESKNHHRDLIVTYRRIDFYEAILYVEMEFVKHVPLSE